MYSPVIKDRFNDVLIVFRIDGGRLRWNSSREEDRIVFMGLFEATGMDFRVDLIFFGQFESMVRSFWLGLGDFKGSNVARIEFCTPSLLLDAEAQILCFQISFVPHLIISLGALSLVG